MSDLRWRIWHIYRWRALAIIARAISRWAERGHHRLHRTIDPGCYLCLDRRREAAEEEPHD